MLRLNTVASALFIFWKYGFVSEIQRTLKSEGLVQTCGELDDKAGIVGLDFRLVRRLVPDYRATFVALMDYYVALFRVGLGFYGAKDSATGVGSVAGVNIYVQRAQTKRAVITRGVAERQNLFAAILTHKAVVVFSKSFVFHIVPLVCFCFPVVK